MKVKCLYRSAYSAVCMGGNHIQRGFVLSYCCCYFCMFCLLVVVFVVVVVFIINCFNFYF